MTIEYINIIRITLVQLIFTILICINCFAYDDCYKYGNDIQMSFVCYQSNAFNMTFKESLVAYMLASHKRISEICKFKLSNKHYNIKNDFLKRKNNAHEAFDNSYIFWIKSMEDRLISGNLNLFCEINHDNLKNEGWVY